MKDLHRKLCTKDSPYTDARHNAGDKWMHNDVIEVGEQEDGWPCGDIITKKCNNCGVTWREELPQ